MYAHRQTDRQMETETDRERNHASQANSHEAHKDLKIVRQFT